MKINYYYFNRLNYLHSCWWCCWLFVYYLIFHVSFIVCNNEETLILCDHMMRKCTNSSVDSNSFGSTVSNGTIKQLRYSILRSYNKNTRPVKNTSKPVSVHIGVQLLQINNLDEVTQQMTTTLRISLRWRDEFLRWNTTKTGYPKSLPFRPDRIWTPDLILQNTIYNHKYDYKERFDYLLSIDSNGNARWVFPMKFTSTCAHKLDYYPFDSTTCALEFRSSAYSEKHLVLKKYSIGIQLELKVDAEYNLKSYSVDELNSVLNHANYNVSLIRFKLRMKRNLNFYLYKIILPYTIFYVISTFTYLLPVDSGEKKSYSTSILLSAMLFLKDISLYIPKTTIFPLISLYYSFNLVLLYICIIISIVVYAIFYTQMKSIPVPRCFRVAISRYFARKIKKKLIDRNRFSRKTIRKRRKAVVEINDDLMVSDEHDGFEILVQPASISTSYEKFEKKLGFVMLNLLKSIKFNLINIELTQKNNNTADTAVFLTVESVEKYESMFKMLDILENYKISLIKTTELHDFKDTDTDKNSETIACCSSSKLPSSVEHTEIQFEISTKILSILKAINKQFKIKMYKNAQKSRNNDDDDVKLSDFIKNYEINYLKDTFNASLNKFRINSLAQNSKWKHLAIYTDRVIFVIYACVIPVSLAMMYYHAEIHSDDDLL